MTELTREPLTKEEAIEFFSKLYYGKHHIPGNEPKQSGYGWSVHHDRGGMSTFDYSDLTRLVLMAHKNCIRADVSAIRNGIIKITIWKRYRDAKDISMRHPTIEQAIETLDF